MASPLRILPLSAVIVLLGAAPALGQEPIRIGSAELRFSGRLHVQYAQGSGAGADPGHLFLRRARLKADLRFGDHLEARLQPDFARGGALEDAWVAFRPVPAFRITMGQFNRTLESFELTSSNDLPVIERDGRMAGGLECDGLGGACTLSRLLADLEFVGRDLGVGVEWDLGAGLVLLGSVTNGTGANTTDENEAKSVSLRSEFTPWHGLTVALFHGRHDHPDPIDTDRTDYARVYGADVTWGRLRGGPRLQAAWAWGDNWRAGSGARFRGGQALGSWYVGLAPGRAFQGIEPLLRLGWADGQVGLDGADGMLLTPGVAAYIHDRSRVALNLDILSPGSASARWSIKVQTYAVF